MLHFFKFAIIWIGLAGLISCSFNSNRKNSKTDTMESFDRGTYGYDVAFFRKITSTTWN